MVAIVTELRKLGATVEEFRDYCVITPPKEVRLGWSDALQCLEQDSASAGAGQCQGSGML